MDFIPPGGSRDGISMPSSRKSATPRRSKPSTRRPSPPPSDSPERPVALQDATEDLADLFEEAIRHLLAGGEPPGWTVGPVRSLALGDVEPGSLGWAASVVSLDSEGSNPQPRPVGDLFLFVLPDVSSEARPTTPPLRGHQWKEFGAHELRNGTPRLLLLTRPADAASALALETWMHRLMEHLVEDLG